MRVFELFLLPEKYFPAIFAHFYLLSFWGKIWVFALFSFLPQTEPEKVKAISTAFSPCAILHAIFSVRYLKSFFSCQSKNFWKFTYQIWWMFGNSELFGVSYDVMSASLRERTLHLRLGKLKSATNPDFVIKYLKLIIY